MRYLTLLLILFVYGCAEDKPLTETSTPLPAIPKFDKDSAFSLVEKQVLFGPRVPNTDAHKACADFLAVKLEQFGAIVTRQSFEATAYNGTKLNGINIIGSINPNHSKRVVLAAHWDTRHITDSPLNTSGNQSPNLGADDGASGVAVWLEVARLIQENPIDLGIDIVFFDLEDYGQSSDEKSWGLGAQYWSKNPHIKGYKAEWGILLDMVGAKNAHFPREQFSVYFAPDLVASVWTLAQRMGYGNYFTNTDGGAITDDHYFVNTIAKIPMIDVIHRPVNSTTGFADHWHTSNDNLEIIDKNTLNAVGQVMLAVLYRKATGNL